jgi:AP-3 complex subunit delta-1
MIDFDRYISILVELTRLEGTKHGSFISLQLLDVAVRVESIRQFACHQMVRFERFFNGNLNLFISGYSY